MGARWTCGPYKQGRTLTRGAWVAKAGLLPDGMAVRHFRTHAAARRWLRRATR